MISHAELAQQIEAAGLVVREDSEDNGHSYVYADADSDEQIGDIYGDENACVEWVDSTFYTVRSDQGVTQIWAPNPIAAIYLAGESIPTDEQIADGAYVVVREEETINSVSYGAPR